MAVVVSVAALTLAYAATRESDAAALRVLDPDLGTDELP